MIPCLLKPVELKTFLLTSNYEYKTNLCNKKWPLKFMFEFVALAFYHRETSSLFETKEVLKSLVIWIFHFKKTLEKMEKKHGKI